MGKPIVEMVRDYFKTCPLLSEDIKVDFLDSEEESFSIEVTPVNPIVRRYVDGSSERQFLFTLASRRFYATDGNRQNIDNLNLFEHLNMWLENNMYDGILPEMAENQEPLSVTAVTGGYLFSVNDGKQNARYQIQCKLTYREKGR